MFIKSLYTNIKEPLSNGSFHLSQMQQSGKKLKACKVKQQAQMRELWKPGMLLTEPQHRRWFQSAPLWWQLGGCDWMSKSIYQSFPLKTKHQIRQQDPKLEKKTFSTDWNAASFKSKRFCFLLGIETGLSKNFMKVFLHLPWDTFLKYSHTYCLPSTQSLPLRQSMLSCYPDGSVAGPRTRAQLSWSPVHSVHSRMLPLTWGSSCYFWREAPSRNVPCAYKHSCSRCPWPSSWRSAHSWWTPSGNSRWCWPGCTPGSSAAHQHQYHHRYSCSLLKQVMDFFRAKEHKDWSHQNSFLV